MNDFDFDNPSIFSEKNDPHYKLIKAGSLRLEKKSPDGLEMHLHQVLQKLCKKVDVDVPSSIMSFHFTPGSYMDIERVNRIVGEERGLTTVQKADNKREFFESLETLSQKLEDYDETDPHIVFFSPTKSFDSFYNSISSKKGITLGFDSLRKITIGEANFYMTTLGEMRHSLLTSKEKIKQAKDDAIENLYTLLQKERALN